MRVPILRSITCIAVLLLVAACSTAAEHKEAFQAFSDSTEKATAALDAYDKAAAKGMTELMIARAAALEPGAVQGAPDACGGESKECYLVLNDENGQPTPIAYKTLIPNHVSAANEIAAYAKSLTDLAAADSSEQVQAALDQAKSNAASLAQIVQPGSAGGVNALLAPFTAAGAYIYRTWQEQTKMAALRKVTTDMDRIIQEAAKKFADVGEFVAEVDTNKRQEAWVMGRLNYVDSEQGNRAARLKDWINASQNYDDALKAPLSAVFTEMGDAHAKLTYALQDHIDSMDDFFAAANRLKIQAEAVQNLVNGFQAAAAQQ